MAHARKGLGTPRGGFSFQNKKTGPERRITFSSSSDNREKVTLREGGGVFRTVERVPATFEKK